MIKVWGGATSRTLRVHWMAAELGLLPSSNYEAKLIGSRSGTTQSPEFRALNAKEKIPVLIDGKLVLTESAAIVTYLGDTYGPETGLVPKPYSQARAKYNEWMSFIQMELDAHTLYVMRKHHDLTDLYGTAPAAIDEAIAGFNKQVAVATTQLERTPYLLGDEFTGADILLLTCLDWALSYQLAIAPRLEEYRRTLHLRPAYKTAGTMNFSFMPDQDA